ncbi:hypothetical protein SBV1_1380010 [Verrucomicrobia bacterium]|nr:hypothetical protein SBV1_1380010 [Verrucomicrobiota bacterium]
MTGWGPEEDEDRISEELGQMFPRFELIDPNQIALSSGKTSSD